MFKVADWLNPVAEGILDYWLLGAFQVVMGFVVFKGLYRVWSYTVEASPYTFFRRMRAQGDEKAQGRLRLNPGRRSLTLQRLQLLDGGDGGEAGGVAAGGGELGLGGLQLGGDDGLVEVLDVPGALGEHGDVRGIDLGKAALDEDARGAGVGRASARSCRAAARRSPAHGRAGR